MRPEGAVPWRRPRERVGHPGRLQSLGDRGRLSSEATRRRVAPTHATRSRTKAWHALENECATTATPRGAKHARGRPKRDASGAPSRGAPDSRTRSFQPLISTPRAPGIITMRSEGVPRTREGRTAQPLARSTRIHDRLKPSFLDTYTVSRDDLKRPTPSHRVSLAVRQISRPHAPRIPAPRRPVISAHRTRELSRFNRRRLLLRRLSPSLGSL